MIWDVMDLRVEDIQPPCTLFDASIYEILLPIIYCDTETGEVRFHIRDEEEFRLIDEDKGCMKEGVVFFPAPLGIVPNWDEEKLKLLRASQRTRSTSQLVVQRNHDGSLIVNPNHEKFLKIGVYNEHDYP